MDEEEYEKDGVSWGKCDPVERSEVDERDNKGEWDLIN